VIEANPGPVGKGERMAFDENAAREMLAVLATECENLRLLLTWHNTAIQHFFSDYPEAWTKLKQDAKQAANDPRVREIVSQKFAACYALAIMDLDDAAAQQLLDRARDVVAKTWLEENDIFGILLN
jgi:hypothetical protein